MTPGVKSGWLIILTILIFPIAAIAQSNPLSCNIKYQAALLADWQSCQAQGMPEGCPTPANARDIICSISTVETAGIRSFIGDNGAGGVAGLVPPPPIGSKAAGWVLGGGGNWGPSASVSPFVGDSGRGGTAGIVPAPPAGSKAAGRVLGAGGGWGAPAAARPFVGDSRAGGTQGLVPAPAAGQGALGYVLGAAGHFFAPTLNMVLNWFGGSLGVANNAALAAFPTSSTGRIVTRDGFASAGDSPDVRFKSESGTCAANSRVNDGGSCVNASDGGSWVALFEGKTLTPMIWGCAGNGTTDDTSCVQSTLNYLGTTGQALYLGPHMYALSGTVTVPPAINIIGDTKGSRYSGAGAGGVGVQKSGFYPTAANLTLLSLTGTGGAAENAGNKFSNFAIRMEGKAGTFVNTSGAAIVLNNTNDVEISGLEIWSPCFGIDDQSSNENFYHNNRISAVYGPNCAGIRLGIGTIGGLTVGPRIDQNLITCNGNNDPANTGRAGVLALDAGGAYFTANDILFCLHGTELNPGLNQEIIWAAFTGTVGGDTDHGNDIYINTSHPTAFVLGAQFTGSWGSNAGALGLYAGNTGTSFLVRNDGGGIVRSISILGQRDFSSSGSIGALDFEAGNDISIIGSRLCPTAGGPASAVTLGPAVSEVSIIGNRIGQCAQIAVGAIVTGISIDAAVDIVHITNNDFLNTTTPIIWAGPPVDKTAIIKDNMGLDNLIYTIPTAPTINLPMAPVVALSGTTTVNTMTTSWSNRRIILVARDGNVTLTGGNICGVPKTLAKGVYYQYEYQLNTCWRPFGSYP